MSSRLTLEALNRCDADTFAASLGDVFEHAPWIAAAVAAQRPYADAAALHAAMMEQVRCLDEAQRVAFYAGHPELAGVQARSGAMTADSTAEQGGLALDRLPAIEAGRWEALNREYQRRFGFPFILCVRRHTRASALRVFERRGGNTREAELAEALREIGHITRLRLANRIAGHGLSRIAGQLTTHVLDTAAGRPAAGVRVQLFEAGEGAPRMLADTRTDADGRTARPLLDGGPLPMGAYELRFHVGDYFRARGAADGEPPFLDVVPVAFGVAEPEAHYHVPLTVTPWAYSTYRGS